MNAIQERAHFLVIAIFALSCIVTVSSYGEEQFREYHKLYSGISVSEEDRSVQLTEDDMAIIDLEIKDLLQELVEERIIVRKLLETGKDDFEIVGTLAYFKFLVSYFIWYSRRSAVVFRGEAKIYNCEKDGELADNLDRLASILAFYLKEPSYPEIFDRFLNLYLHKMKKSDPQNIAYYEKQVKELRENSFDPIFKPWDTETDYINASSKGIDFFYSELRGASPDTSCKIIPDFEKEGLMERIDKFRLLEPGPYTYFGIKCSRVSTIIQVFMVTVGWRSFATLEGQLKSMEAAPASITFPD